MMWMVPGGWLDARRLAGIAGSRVTPPPVGGSVTVPTRGRGRVRPPGESAAGEVPGRGDRAAFDASAPAEIGPPATPPPRLP